jgi:hypothetical protein
MNRILVLIVALAVKPQFRPLQLRMTTRTAQSTNTSPFASRT